MIVKRGQFRLKNDQRIVVGMTPSGMNVAAVRRSLGAKGVVVAETPVLTDGLLPGVTMQRLARFDPKKEAQVVLVLPRRQVLLKYLTLPSNKPDELRRMVDLQIGQGLPFPADEIVYQMATGEEDANGYTRVIVAVARRQMVEECLAAALKSDIHPGRCAVGAFGIAAWHAQNFPLDAGRTVIIADIDDDGVELCFCREGKLIFGRNLIFSRNDWAFPEAFEQVSLTLEAFEREYSGQQPEKIILTGIEDRMNFLKEVFTKTLNISPEHIVADQNCLPNPSKDADVNAPQRSLCACLGLALAADLGPDLTPPSVLNMKFMGEQRLALIRLGVTFVLMLGVFALALGLNVHRQENSLKALRQKIAAGKTEAQDASRKIKFFDLIRRNKNERISIAEMMKEIYQVLPQTTALTSLQLSDDVLTIQGQSRESSDVNLVQKAMLDSPLFKDVTLQYANRPQRLAMEYTEFKIQCHLRGSEGEDK